MLGPGARFHQNPCLGVWRWGGRSTVGARHVEQPSRGPRTNPPTAGGHGQRLLILFGTLNLEKKVYRQAIFRGTGPQGADTGISPGRRGPRFSAGEDFYRLAGEFPVDVLQVLKRY